MARRRGCGRHRAHRARKRAGPCGHRHPLHTQAGRAPFELAAMTRKRSAASRARRRQETKKRVAAAVARSKPTPAVVLAPAVASPAATAPADAPDESTADTEIDPAHHPAIEYLQRWHYAREAWRFHKNQQTYLLRHALDARRVPKPYFGTLVRYTRELTGAARQVRSAIR